MLVFVVLEGEADLAPSSSQRQAGETSTRYRGGLFVDMSAMDTANDPKKGVPGNAQQSTSKVPRQVKVKDSRQIQTERNGAAPTDKKKPNYREAAKAVGKGNTEILGSEHLRFSHQIDLLLTNHPSQQCELCQAL